MWRIWYNRPAVVASELLLVLVCIFSGLWLWPGPLRQVTVITGIVLVGSGLILRRHDCDYLGFGWRGFLSTMVWGLPIVVASLVVISCVTDLRLPTTSELALRFGKYFIWGLAQQVGMQAFIFLRCLTLFRRPRTAVVLSAWLFGLMHLPNPLLTLITLAAGFGLSLIYYKFRNLYALALMHAVLGLALVFSVPNGYMKVGRGFLKDKSVWVISQ